MGFNSGFKGLNWNRKNWVVLNGKLTLEKAMDRQRDDEIF